MFWLYDIKNISDYDMEKMVFGYIVGTITGGDGDSGDDWADFEKSDDIAFSYDNGTDLETGLGGIGSGGWSPVGLAGYAFLESPGNPYDGIDNDGDGCCSTEDCDDSDPNACMPGAECHECAVYENFGCCDENACNYDASANTDNDSCEYPASNADCSGACLAGYIDVQGECVAIVEGCTGGYLRFSKYLSC